MKDNSKVTISLGQADLTTLMRFFARGERCAMQRHDGYSISTYDCTSISKKLKEANREMKTIKAKVLLAKAEGKQNESCPLTESVDLRTKLKTNHVDNEV